VLATVIGVRIIWVFVMAYVPRKLSRRIRDNEPAPTKAQVFIVAWAGMRGVVSLAAAFAVPATTLSGDPFPGRPQLVFLTFVVVVGTLLLHGLTLPWLIKVLDVPGDDTHQDALDEAAAQTKAAQAAADRLDAIMAAQRSDTDVPAWEQLGRSDDEIGEGPAAAFRRLRLEMLQAERQTFIDERDAGRINDEVLRSVLRGLDLEEATLDRD
jgi:hypothetical protein